MLQSVAADCHSLLHWMIGHRWLSAYQTRFPEAACYSCLRGCSKHCPNEADSLSWSYLYSWGHTMNKFSELNAGSAATSPMKNLHNWTIALEVAEHCPIILETISALCHRLRCACAEGSMEMRELPCAVSFPSCSIQFFTQEILGAVDGLDTAEMCCLDTAPV